MGAGPYAFNASTYPIIKLTDWNDLLEHGLEKGFAYFVRLNGSYYEAIKAGTSTDAGKISFGGSGNAGAVDGTDASAVIQAALDDASGDSLPIYCKGSFACTTSITNDTGNVGIVGGGRQSTIFTFADGVKGFDFNDSGASTVRTFMLRDFTIVGENKQLLDFYKCDDVVIDNVEIIGGGETSVSSDVTKSTMAIQASYGYMITRLLIWDGGTAYALDPAHIGLYVYTSADVKMSHSVFTGCVDSGMMAHDSSMKSTNNEYNNNGEFGANLYQASNCHFTSDVFYYNNWSGLNIHEETGSITHTGHGIVNCQFQDNDQGSLGYHALRIVGSGGVGADPKYIKVLGNTFWGTVAGYGVGILNNTSNVTVIGNTFLANAGGAINVAGTATYITVKDNPGLVTENTGQATGTGVQQTVAHGLVTTPDIIILSTYGNDAGANPYCSAAADATNIYVTAANGVDWFWYCLKKYGA